MTTILVLVAVWFAVSISYSTMAIAIQPGRHWLRLLDFLALLPSLVLFSLIALIVIGYRAVFDERDRDLP